MAESNKFELTQTDKIKWLMNVGLYLSIPTLLYLGYVQTNISDGFQWSDFIPNLFIIGSIVTYFLSSTVDLIKKFVSGK